MIGDNPGDCRERRSAQIRFTFVPLRSLLVSVGETEDHCVTARWTGNLHANR